MGRTRRSGRALPTTTLRLPYEQVDILEQLKHGSDEPLYQVIQRLLDSHVNTQNNQAVEKLQKVITTFGQDFDIILQDLYEQECIISPTAMCKLSEKTRTTIVRFAHSQLDKEQEFNEVLAKFI